MKKDKKKFLTAEERNENTMKMLMDIGLFSKCTGCGGVNDRSKPDKLCRKCFKSKEKLKRLDGQKRAKVAQEQERKQKAAKAYDNFGQWG